MKKRGFTIIELMLVVGIIAILMTLVISASKGAIESARAQRANALCASVQQGLAAYRAQKGEWPSPINKGAGISSNAINNNGDTEKFTYELDSSEVRQVVLALVTEAKRNNPLMDISGLFVSRHAGSCNSRHSGMDFMTAIRGSKHDKRKMKSSEMYFGYPESRHGFFRDFKIVYSIPNDQLTVSKQDKDWR